jgi:UDP-2-acetamido-2,6-beta-L-arabino-hexul-4-ose reductase
MIIGNGDIGKVLNDREGAILLASGVSNSQCTDFKEFEREWELIWNLHKVYDYTKICLFYFSTISIFTNDTRYTLHKIEMENLVRTFWHNHNIIRIGNIDWGKNPHTFINAIKTKQAKGESVEIRDEWKYMISKEQLLLLTDNLPLKGQNTISVFGDMRKVKDCII